MDPELMKIVLATMGGGNQETIAEYNPYLQFAAAPQAMAQTIQANIGKSVDSNELWKNAFAASIGGLASGALQGLGQDYQGTLTDRYNSALQNTLEGKPVDSSNLPLGLFGDIQRKAKLFQLQSNMSDYVKRQELKQAEKLLEFKNKLAVKQAGDIEAAKIEGQNRGWIGGGKSASKPPTESAVEASPFALPKEGGMESGQRTIENNPNSPFYKAEKEKKEATFVNEQKLRKEYNALPIVKKFGGIAVYADAMAKALQDTNAMTDLELVRYSILMIEPEMAVREGEQSAVLASQSIPQGLKGQMAKALNGESALTQQSREGLRNLAMRAYDAHKTQYLQATSSYQQMAKDYGLNPDRLGYMGEIAPIEKIFGPAMSASSILKKAKSDPSSVTPLERQYMETQRAISRGK